MSQLDEIADGVKSLNVKMDSFTQWRGQVDERCRGERRRVEGLHNTVYGKKQDGLLADVQCLMNNKRRQMTWRDFWLGVFQGVVKWGIIAVAVTLLYMWKSGGAAP